MQVLTSRIVPFGNYAHTLHSLQLCGPHGTAHNLLSPPTVVTLDSMLHARLNARCKVLKSESHAELDLASPRSLICTPYFADGLAEGARVRGKIAGLAKLNHVEQVVDLCAEIQTEAFGNLGCLLQYEIPIVSSGTTEVVPTQVSGHTERSILKQWSSWQPEIRSSLSKGGTDRSRKTIRVEIGPLSLARMRRVSHC